MKQAFWKRAILTATFVTGTLLAGCGNTYSRDDFTAGVIGKSEAEVTTKFGKPAGVEASPERAVWTYNRETFDLSNQNRIDSKATVTFEGPAGQRHATKVDFS
jgi:hypothetical protein